MSNDEVGIRDVWSHNLEKEFREIVHVVQKFPYVAMDTEFPGVVARPIGEFVSTADYQYQLLRCNVDLLKLIQLGLTFLDEDGNLPSGITTWQFNFKFNLTEDMYAEDSVDLLQNSGLQFEKHEQEGIDPKKFAEFLFSSGLVLMDEVRWLSFHSGYDFGYLLKLLTNRELPKSEAEFFEDLNLYFPRVYDVKYLMKSCKTLKGGLQEVANELDVPRIGPQHQAGSDSLLTGQTFFKMRAAFFLNGDIDESKYCGHLYGLGGSVVTAGATSTTDAATLATAFTDLSIETSSANNVAATDLLPSVPSVPLTVVGGEGAMMEDLSLSSGTGQEWEHYMMKNTAEERWSSMPPLRDASAQSRSAVPTTSVIHYDQAGGSLEIVEHSIPYQQLQAAGFLNSNAPSFQPMDHYFMNSYMPEQNTLFQSPRQQMDPNNPFLDEQSDLFDGSL